MSSDKTQAPAVPSSTILMLRESADGFEVFMVVRNYQIDFASGALVFPGGKVDDGDRSAAVRARCINTDGLDAESIALRVCGVREVFEECGVLLARRGATWVDPSVLPDLEATRQAVHDGTLDMGGLMGRYDLTLDMTALTPFAHWITPDMMPRRYDTHFFLADCPHDGGARHDGAESVDSVWIDPRRALEEAEGGKWTVIFPTRMNLMKLARSATVAEALSRAAQEPIVTVKPWIEQGADGPMLHIPTDAGYEVTAEPLDRP